ncbi:hypothetical protein Q5P01_022410 [Channa striata]|uniref:Secreted protein n=1 Tax=Channa striata TaxID=64152 RepID=A0AA88LRD1_CHASR|nr:hypothetical protein Q5P01_022410 [Channa striata]
MALITWISLCSLSMVLTANAFNLCASERHPDHDTTPCNPQKHSASLSTHRFSFKLPWNAVVPLADRSVQGALKREGVSL